MKKRSSFTAWYWLGGLVLLVLAAFAVYVDGSYRDCVREHQYERSMLFAPLEDIERVCWNRHIGFYLFRSYPG